MASYIDKIGVNLPWLARYPLTRLKTILSRNLFEKKRLIFTIANHFEPSWREKGHHDTETQLRRLDEWFAPARKAAEMLKDADGKSFRHTYFFPVEQYEKRIGERLEQLQAEDLGEIEIHLHHGVEKPDTSENLRRTLIYYRDLLASEHRLLSCADNVSTPQYAFVHGNLALANSCGGKFCGVDDEMRILQETGCYMDLTLPSAPDKTQVPVINQIYECGLPLEQKIPHRAGKNLEVGRAIKKLPIILQGPLTFDFSRRRGKLLVPRIDTGNLTRNWTSDSKRLDRWISARVGVSGDSETIFIKLFCHGFFDGDESACIGEDARRFFGEVIENGEKTGDYKVYFATARETFNMISAAVENRRGQPQDFRDYKLKPIMKVERESSVSASARCLPALLVFAQAFVF